MAIRVYNTLTRDKEVFEPISAGRVNMYVCGPTVYDACHIGHARSIVVFDVIVRYLRECGYRTTYIRNFTDIDDKIIRRARELDEKPADLAEKYIREFYEDMEALNVMRADREPRVTEHIDSIVGIITQLIQNGLAYEIDGDVYFAVEKFKGYGKLSGRRPEDMMAGARVEVDTRKQNPLDFALWKSAKPGEPYWESPWGRGRPGWHIECSAMSREFLGETFDIHGGGEDLIFPHHENEIAQSEGASGKPLAKYWIHNGFVKINQEKMSKSLGNFLMIKEVVKKWHPEAVRLFLLSKHYRSPIDFSEAAMAETAAGLDRLYTLLERLETAIGPPAEAKTAPGGRYWKDFCTALDDDFNTARGIAVLFDAVRSTNRGLDQATSPIPTALASKLSAERDTILKIGGVLGIFRETPEVYFQKQRAGNLARKDIDAADIDRLVAERSSARKNKNWAKADEIRDRLLAMNITLEDRPDGTIWKFST